MSSRNRHRSDSSLEQDEAKREDAAFKRLRRALRDGTYLGRSVGTLGPSTASDGEASDHVGQSRPSLSESLPKEGAKDRMSGVDGRHSRDGNHDSPLLRPSAAAKQVVRASEEREDGAMAEADQLGIDGEMATDDDAPEMNRYVELVAAYMQTEAGDMLRSSRLGSVPPFSPLNYAIPWQDTICGLATNGILQTCLLSASVPPVIVSCLSAMPS